MIYESDFTDAMYFLFPWLAVMSFDVGLAFGFVMSLLEIVHHSSIYFSATVLNLHE